MKRNELANALFNRLNLICPSCGDFLPRSNYLTSYTTHCSTMSNLVLFQAKLAASASCGDCNFNTLLEYLVSLSSAYIVTDDSTLLIVSSCPLYISSLKSTDCLMIFSSSFSSGSVAGGTIGGLIAGVVLASIVAIIIVVLLILYRRKRDSCMEEKDLTPHPMSSTRHRRSTNKKDTEEDDYEFIPMFGAAPINIPSENEGDYEDPSQLNIPKTLSVSGGYEIPECLPQSPLDYSMPIKKKKSRSKFTIKKIIVATEGTTSSKVDPTLHQVSSKQKKNTITAAKFSNKTTKSGKKDEKDNNVSSSERNMYTTVSNVRLSNQQRPSKGQIESIPLKPVGGKNP